MAARDVELYSCGDQTGRRVGHRTNITAATFVEGEPVSVDGSGEIDISSNVWGNDPATIYGIAVEPAVSKSNRMAALEIEDTQRVVDQWTPVNLFRCRYFATGGLGAVVVPTNALALGQTGNLVSNGTNWAFDVGAGNANAICVDVLDEDGLSLADDRTANKAGDSVVIRPL